MLISTSVLMEALRFYASKGYAPIDVPLVVDMDVSEHTKPEGVPELYHGKVGKDHKVYVASGEQSFIQLHREGKLPNGSYMAVTPCYRHERHTSETHYLMFMKLELIVVGDITFANCDDIIESVADDAREFFLSLGHDVNRWDNNSEIDLTTSHGIELGSYGYRKMLDGTGYVYGTGCAFPRVSL
jgi:hypothetical protein